MQYNTTFVFVVRVQTPDMEFTEEFTDYGRAIAYASQMEAKGYTCSTTSKTTSQDDYAELVMRGR